jgi:D-alanyl-D-alanine carboxypeptidase
VDPDITIRQLLSHTSGLSDFTDQPGWLAELLADPDRSWGMEEYFLATIRPPYFEKGTAWSYSTSGYLLLRMLIEEVSGMSVAEAYRHYVLDPLSLQATYVCPGDILPPERVHGWIDLTGDGSYDDLTVLPPTAFCSAAGGQVYTTSGDLAKLAKGLMLDRTILTSDSYEAMTDFYFPSGHDEPMVKGYGLGLMWFHESFTSGYKVLGHGGNHPGYAAGSFFLPDLGVVIGIMDNTEYGESMVAMDRILEVIGSYLDGR